MKAIIVPWEIYLRTAGKPKINCRDVTDIPSDCENCSLEKAAISRNSSWNCGDLLAFSEYNKGRVKLVPENGLAFHKIGKFYE